MEAASRPEFEPLTEAGPEMPAAPAPLPAPAVNRLLEQSLPPLAPLPGTAAAGAAPAAAPVAPAGALPGGSAPAAPAAAAAAPPPPNMDRDFIARNQIVERYLSGKLPIKGATDFERFCKAHPELLDQLGLPERVHAGLRLLEAAGKPEPWAEEPKRFWEKPYLAIGLGAATLVLLIALAVLASRNSDKAAKITKLEATIASQPLEPATSTRTIRLLPNYKGSSNSPAVVIGGGANAQLADMRIDLSRSAYRTFRITVDRIDQGRVVVLHNMQKDSNGHVRIALNSSALGPGNYAFTIEGMTWKGENVPEAWITIGIQR
jgi:hypothetical protein